jgi:hypothetical protein
VLGCWFRASREAPASLEEGLWVECQAKANYEAYRFRGQVKDGRRFGAPPKPYVPPATPAGKLNTPGPAPDVARPTDR